MGKIVRLQVDFDESKMQELASFMEETHTNTKKEVINAALTLLKWAAKQKREGRVIASLDEESGSYRELEMPILSEIVPDSELVK